MDEEGYMGEEDQIGDDVEEEIEEEFEKEVEVEVEFEVEEEADDDVDRPVHPAARKVSASALLVYTKNYLFSSQIRFCFLTFPHSMYFSVPVSYTWRFRLWCGEGANVRVQGMPKACCFLCYALDLLMHRSSLTIGGKWYGSVFFVTCPPSPLTTSLNHVCPRGQIWRIQPEPRHLLSTPYSLLHPISSPLSP